MKRKLFFTVLLLALVISIFAGCENTSGGGAVSDTQPAGTVSPETDAPETGTPADDAVFTARTVGARYLDETQNTTVELRYYGDLPYMSIEDFIPLLYRGRNFPEGRDRVTVVRAGDEYTVTTAGGMSAVFNAAKNTFETADFELFKSTHFTETGKEGCVSYDAMPFIKVESVVPDREAEPTAIDFDDYGIDVRGDGEHLYLPVPTLFDIFSCQNILAGGYNGKDVCFYYYTEGETMALFGAEYFDDLFLSPRTAELAEYNYNEICLNYDRFLGRPGRSALENHYDLSGGLDAALESDAAGREVKALLKSVDLTDYLTGLYLFGMLTADGGHTVYNPLALIYFYDKNGIPDYPEWLSVDLRTEMTEAADAVAEKYADIFGDAVVSFRHHDDVYNARSEMLSKQAGPLAGRETYTLAGDTAIIHVDSFMGEIYQMDAWRDYYAGKTDEIPFSDTDGGAVGAIYYGLTKANEDGVKRIVIDLSANTGGSTDEMLYLISLLTGRSELFIKTRTTGQILSVRYRVDRNLDRVFDEKDGEFDLVGGRELAVITSQNGFSCGGVCPVMLHEYGIYTLGENCGGGSCAIYLQYDAYGLERTASCPVQMLTPSGVDIDTARLTVCDTPLETGRESASESIDYTAFFDVNSLNEQIDARYSAAE
ncbi:MAG: hypothetical protein IJR90_04725 [Clostridia bacterium]|nr:hypothetical protein [Clostridia bacterium]